MPTWKKLNEKTGKYEAIPGGEIMGAITYNETPTFPELLGKTAIFLGDSYTKQMEAMLKTMCADFNMSADNRGIVSSTITGDTLGNRGYQPMWKRAQAISEEYVTAGKNGDVALIMFMGGANDGFGVETYLGTSITEMNNEKIYGAMHTILNTFRKNFPNAKILTVLQPSSFNRDVTTITDDATAEILGFPDLATLQTMDNFQFSNYAMYQKERIVRDVAEFYSTDILDCCFGWYSVLNEDHRTKYWNADKLHLSGAGYEDLTARIKAKIIEMYS